MPNLSAHIQTFSVLDNPYAGTDMPFESSDGYVILPSGSGEFIFESAAWTARVGPTLNDAIELIKADPFPLYDYTWDKRRQLRLRLTSQIGNDPTGEFYLLNGNGTGPWTGFGLVFTPTKIMGRVGDASAVTDLDLFTGLTPGDVYNHLYEIIFYPGNGAYFYVDGALIGSITTNLPTGTLNAEELLHLYLFNNAVGEGAELRFTRIQFSQDR